MSIKAFTAFYSLALRGAAIPKAPAPQQKKYIVLFDSLRNFFTGALLPLTEVVLMLHFINYLQGNTLEKTFLAMAVKSGYLISIPFSLYLMRKGLAVRNSLSLVLLLSLVATALSLIASSAAVLIFLAAIIGLSLHGCHTLASEIYSSYPKQNRGRMGAFSNIALFLGSIVFTFIFQQTIGASLNFHMVISITAFALLLAIISTRGIKMPPLLNKNNKEKRKQQQQSLSLKNVLKVMKTDKMFVYVITAWMMLGLGNLWLLPYRTNLLAEQAFGFVYDEKTILLILVVIPEITYVAFSIPFGIFFDKFNFIVLRIAINIMFIAYFVLFFFGTNAVMHAAGMLCFGFARAGGTLAWKMWINKMVDGDRVPVYMTVHMAATGLRMVATPLFGLIGLYTLGPKVCGIISIAFMATSIIMFVPLIKYGKTRFSN